MPIGPVLVPAKRGIIHIGLGNVGTEVAAKICAAVAAIANPTIVQSIETEGIHIGVFRDDFGEDLDEEVAIWTKEAQHAAVGILLEIDLGNLMRLRRNPAPVWVLFIDLPLKAGWVDSQDAHAEPLVFGDVALETAGRDMRAAPLEEHAIVIGIKWVDEAQFTDRDAVRGRGRPTLCIHAGERIAAAGCLSHPRRHPNLPERPRVKGLLHDGGAPDLWLITARRVAKA